jgi:hypothetical protein
MTTTQRHILSFVVTFVAAFLSSLGLQLAAGIPIELNSAFFLAMGLSAVRSGMKAVVEKATGVTADPQ